MAKLWSIEDLLGQDERDVLVWHHRLNQCPFKYLLRLSRRGIIPNNISELKKLPPFVACLFVKSHRRPWMTKLKCSGGYIRKPSDTRPVAMTSIYQMVYVKPGLTPQVTVSLTHERFWSVTVFVDHYSY